MFKVRYEVYTRYLGMFDDEDELTWEESNEYEYKTLEQAEKEANKNKEGWRGTFVEVYINDEFYRDYEV